MAKDKKKKDQAAEPERPGFDDLIQGDQEYQSAFDERVNQAVLTARTKWERVPSRRPGSARGNTS